MKLIAANRAKSFAERGIFMTLNDIIVEALGQTDRGHDAQTLDVWRDKLTGFANDGIIDLAHHIKPLREESCPVENGMIDCAALKRPCIKVVRVTQNGKTLKFGGENCPTGKIAIQNCGAGGNGESANVLYAYLPKPLSAPTDVPELPPLCHRLIVTYVVARERASGDVSTQNGGNVFFRLYYEGKAKLPQYIGKDDGFAILNRW